MRLLVRGEEEDFLEEVVVCIVEVEVVVELLLGEFIVLLICLRH